VEGYMNEFTGCNDVKEFTEYLRKKVQKWVIMCYWE
jgi:hypothetical protein